MEFKDYYATMGVARDATAEQIKQAYRKLARRYHPDVSKEPDAEARFKDVGEAYEVLRDPEKRAAYDQLGSGPRPGDQFQPPPDWGAGFEFHGDGKQANGGHGAAFEGDPSEFFETLFGRAGFAGGQAHRRREHGEDHHARVMIDLDASLEGGARTLTLRLPEIGEDGRPRLRERTLTVKIPKGIQAGSTYGLPARARNHRAKQELATSFSRWASHRTRLYRPEGRDLHFDLPVAPWEAALGASVTVPTPEGPVSLRVPPGSRAGTRLRLRGRGLPTQPAGDLYAVLQIALPPADSDVARAAYEAFAAADAFQSQIFSWSGIMTTQGLSVSVGYVVEDERPLSLDDLCRLCAVEQQFILELVDEGVLETRPSAELHFVGRSLRRARLRGDCGAISASMSQARRW